MTLLVFLALYSLTIVALAWSLQRIRALESRAVFLSLFIFGLATGILAVALWPMDTSVYPNVLAGWAGDWLYVHAIEWIGDPSSDQAHYTIPWVLRVPQVYAFVSAVMGGALGLANQWLYDRRRFLGIKRCNERPAPVKE